MLDPWYPLNRSDGLKIGVVDMFVTGRFCGTGKVQNFVQTFIHLHVWPTISLCTQCIPSLHCKESKLASLDAPSFPRNRLLSDIAQ